MIQQLTYGDSFLHYEGWWRPAVNIPGRCAGRVELESAPGPVWRRWNVSRSVLRPRPRRDVPRAACRVPPHAKIMSWEIGLVPMLLVCNVADWIWAEDGRGLRLNPISAATPTALLHKSASCRRSTVSQLSSETQNKSGNCFGRSCVSGRKMRTFWLPLFVIAFAQIT